MTRPIPIAAALAPLLVAAGGAAAEPLALTGQDENRWRFVLTPYAFIPFQTSGTSVVDGDAVALDLGFEEAVEVLDFALAGRFEAWKGDLGFILDANYVSLFEEVSQPGPGPFGGSVDVEVDIEQYWFTFLGAYRVADGTYGSAGRRYAVDLQGGVKYNSLTQDISIDTPGPSTDLGGTKTWWEPVIGARGVWQLNDQWSAALMAEAGGFGVNGSDLQALVTAGVDWRPKRWQNTSLKFGYRYYSIDYAADGGDFAYDIEQHGPYLGVTFRWQ